MKFCLIIVTLCLIIVTASAQTSSELDAKYGQPQKFYEVRPGVMMTMTFNDEGQACAMRVERHNATESTIYLNTTFYPQGMAEEIVNDLVPVKARGAKSKDLDLISITGTGGSRNEDYENVHIAYHFSITKDCSGIVAVIIQWKNRGCKQG